MKKQAKMSHSYRESKSGNNMPNLLTAEQKAR